VVNETQATSMKSAKEKDSAFNMFDNYIYDQLSTLEAIDEYDAYCVAPSLPKEPSNLIQY
jgi:hypothetical protein